MKQSLTELARNEKVNTKELKEGQQLFTFVIISYNQEKYIIEHLESIKYQIEQYGKNTQINLILSDDSSTDQTVKWAELWLEKHRDLFHNIQLFVNEENQGIVKNYLLATAKIETPRYKILGGDDVYYKNNVFETMDLLIGHDIIFTPSFAFNDSGVTIYPDINNLLTLKSNDAVRKYLKYAYPFHTVGTFYKTMLIQNEGLRNYIEKYTWIEDLPSVYYIFQKKKTLKYSIDYKPYIMYRNEVGISNNQESDKNDLFAVEEEQIKKDIGMILFKKGFNLNYFRVAFTYKYIALKANVFPKNRKIKRKLEQERLIARNYLDALKEKAEQFMSVII